MINYKDEKTLQAVYKQCDGDMRRVVNLLQALGLSKQNGIKGIEVGEIDENYIYSFTGNITPTDVD